MNFVAKIGLSESAAPYPFPPIINIKITATPAKMIANGTAIVSCTVDGINLPAQVMNMKKLYTTFATILLITSFGSAQSDLVLFSDGGEKFIATVNGQAFNDVPLARVECSGLLGEGQRINIDFENDDIESLKKNFMIEPGMRYMVAIKKNKKGNYVLRPMDMGVPLAQGGSNPRPDHSDFQEVEEVPTSSTRSTTSGTNVHITETSATTGDGEKVNVGIRMNGVDIDMNMSVEDGMGATNTTTTTTMTTTNSGNMQILENSELTETEYDLPGYSGPVGCPVPMSKNEYTDAKSSIGSKDFADSKMTLAKQVGNSKCFLTDHVIGIMSEFNFEDDKLEFAKFAYDRTYDIGNYYKVNDAFTFESSIDELNEFIQEH